MKIDKSGLHPLYDQSTNEENRLTHALLHTIGSSQWLFIRFLTNLVGINTSLIGKRCEISTQKVPSSHGDSDLKKIESIPDAWIVDDCSKIGIAIEVKGQKNSLRFDQLRKHAERVQEYDRKYLLVITPDLKKPEKVIELANKEGKRLNVVWISWDKIYRWLIDLNISKSAQLKKDQFLVSSMKEYLERRREVLGFQGIYFSSGFNALEAKAILNSEMEEIEPTVMKLYKELRRRRPTITTISQESVWDCFGSEKGFTADLHITFGINERAHDIGLTVPNAANEAWLRLKKIFSNDDLLNELFSILKTLKENVPHVFIEFIQRHFIARRFGVRDGYMEFNIDTFGTPFRKKNSKAKEFSPWLPAIKEAIVNKKRINGQVMFKARFFLNETKGIERSQFIKTVKATVGSLKTSL
ncbi:MAG: hypothetical protein ABII26_01025 [Pseudomonadota bacterium]